MKVPDQNQKHLKKRLVQVLQARRFDNFPQQAAEIVYQRAVKGACWNEKYPREYPLQVDWLRVR